jgi:hypothetical protein
MSFLMGYVLGRNTNENYTTRIYDDNRTSEGFSQYNKHGCTPVVFHGYPEYELNTDEQPLQKRMVGGNDSPETEVFIQYNKHGTPVVFHGYSEEEIDEVYTYGIDDEKIDNQPPNYSYLTTPVVYGKF